MSNNTDTGAAAGSRPELWAEGSVGSAIWGAIWVGLALWGVVGCAYELVKWLW